MNEKTYSILIILNNNNDNNSHKSLLHYKLSLWDLIRLFEHNFYGLSFKCLDYYHRMIRLSVLLLLFTCGHTTCAIVVYIKYVYRNFIYIRYNGHKFGITCNPPTQYSIIKYIFCFSVLYRTSSSSTILRCFKF